MESPSTHGTRKLQHGILWTLYCVSVVL
ncbi:hypothetical protein SEVIR_7G286508v4 [Setaria viridis]